MGLGDLFVTEVAALGVRQSRFYVSCRVAEVCGTNGRGLKAIYRMATSESSGRVHCAALESPCHNLRRRRPPEQRKGDSTKAGYDIELTALRSCHRIGLLVVMIRRSSTWAAVESERRFSLRSIRQGAQYTSCSLAHDKSSCGTNANCRVGPAVCPGGAPSR